MKYFLLLILFMFYSCNGNSDDKSFVLKDSVNNSQERIFNELPVIKKLDLNKIDLFYVLKLEEDEEKLFLLNGDKLEIVSLDKQHLDLSNANKITFRKGKGPGELLSITDYDVFKNKIYISDKQQSKISIYELNGTLEQEVVIPDIIIDRIQVIDHDRILTFSLKTGDHVFNIVNRNGEVVDSFVRTEANLHYLMYTGDIFYKNSFLYFAGYSEPILKKYSIKQKEFIYSVNTIDDYSTVGNYVKSETGDFISSSYTPGALFNSLGYYIFQDSLYMSRHHNGEVGAKYLDIYNSSTGKYLFSYNLEHYPNGYGIIVDESYIYSLEKSQGDKEWLVVYNKI